MAQGFRSTRRGITARFEEPEKELLQKLFADVAQALAPEQPASEDSLERMLELAPAGHEAHPRTEHWAPLYIAMGAAEASGATQRDVAVDGFWFGLSKRSWQFS